jgi:hypothetical protein
MEEAKAGYFLLQFYVSDENENEILPENKKLCFRESSLCVLHRGQMLGHMAAFPTRLRYEISSK